MQKIAPSHALGSPARVSDPGESDGTVAECIQTACRLGDGVVSARADGNVLLYG